MNIYHFGDPDNYRYAQAGRRGTWFPDNGEGTCPECTAARQIRIQPLIMEWLPGSDVIGDFVWPGFDTEVVVSQRVRKLLEESFDCCDYFPVEMSMRLTRMPKSRSRPIVKLPYTGTPLWDMQPRSWCHLDLDKSGVELKLACGTCGNRIYDQMTDYERQLVVDTRTWDRSEIFRIYEYPGWIFCTENVKLAVENAQSSNVAFHLDGYIPAGSSRA
jgi:hypothetical protein